MMIVRDGDATKTRTMHPVGGAMKKMITMMHPDAAAAAHPIAVG